MRLTQESVDRQCREMWDSLADADQRDPDYGKAYNEAVLAEEKLRAELARQERLTEAAPELLAALKGFMHADPDVFRAELAMARAVIAKVEALKPFP